MKGIKKYLNHIFIDGLSGMAQGLFCTLIVGTIIQQIGQLIGGEIGNYLFLFGKAAAALTGAGIGVGVACRFKESALVVLLSLIHIFCRASQKRKGAERLCAIQRYYF